MFLLIDNYDSFTYNLVQAFAALGMFPHVVRNDDASLLSLATNGSLLGVCISPGPGHPDNAGLCKEFLQRLPSHIPVLGVCLGHQILARHAGASVVVGSRIMHGKASSIHHDGTGVFSGLPNPMRVGRYHSLVAEIEKDQATVRVTAQTADDDVMAFEYCDRPWTGVQFHPESVLTVDGVQLLDNFLARIRCKQKSMTDESCDVPVADNRHHPAPASLPHILDTVARGENLSPALAHTAFTRLMNGEMTEGQAGALLIGLRAKGETSEEMAEAVKAIIAKAVPVSVPQGVPVLDVVGTGGDGRSSFNCSTATALTIAAMGHKVLKHGNRSVSSLCGSADVLEGLGVAIDTPMDAIQETLVRDNFVFLFAPRFHPSFRHVMPVRQELGIRTLFNLVGPLVNPGQPNTCLLGVAREELLLLLANTLALLGGRSGAVVYGAGGYDELTTLGPAHIAYVRGNTVSSGVLDPAEFGFSPCDPQDLAIDGPEEGVAVLRKLLQGKGSQAMREMLALNVGFCLHLLHPEKKVAHCMEEAKQAVAAGVGSTLLHTLAGKSPLEINH